MFRLFLFSLLALVSTFVAHSFRSEAQIWASRDTDPKIKICFRIKIDSCEHHDCQLFPADVSQKEIQMAFDQWTYNQFLRLNREWRVDGSDVSFRSVD